ncbi:MAG: beta-ketoacyl-[acyl-carrier-protein] synthase family protein [Deltaproteobacteria bacterium]|nr:beta-ketoacyl-[acyl-carrier-protein] synthase family protein [Deltaproteobacteria bacterium]MBW2382826.1 beta-ketoacyl-[acyl-carrier-protein] synthase family protein [Deltaproteobacteria bacterium]MBW2695052.1 beta-ketoacyl-[acyl-carrier-protein] synthase family protein [Deltaproteobacteria bacterium]
MSRRVVITGMGVIAPNANGLASYEEALRKGQSGIRHVEEMAAAKFACTVGGVPQGVDALAEQRFDQDELLAMNMSHRYCSLATLEAWLDAGLERPARDDDHVHWDTGAILGTGIGGMDTTAAKVVPLTDAGKVRRLGSTSVEQVMASGISARVSGQFGLGNQVTTNSSACSTGTEAIAMGVERIRAGLAERMLCGGAEAASHYIWAGFDAMRVLNRGSNDEPERASRPMSASAGGFIPGAGAGVLVVESEDAARARGARIHAEVAGAAVNCGGHRGGGSMTAPNPESVRRCIDLALGDAKLTGDDVDAINGHLTATGADPKEVGSWAAALGRGPGELPPITSTKSMIGHSLGAAGAVESVASVLMLKGGFVHPSINCEDVHPEIEPYESSIPHTLRELPEMRVIIKAGFGFGDVNACLVFRKWEDGA